MEMAGVEPASETANRQASTCVSRDWFSSFGSPAGEAPKDQVVSFKARQPTDDVSPDPI